MIFLHNRRILGLRDGRLLRALRKLALRRGFGRRRGARISLHSKTRPLKDQNEDDEHQNSGGKAEEGARPRKILRPEPAGEIERDKGASSSQLPELLFPLRAPASFRLPRSQLPIDVV